MVKFQVQMPDGKLLFTDDYKIKDVSVNDSVVCATEDNLHVMDFNNWKRVYRKYQIVNGERQLYSVYVVY